MSDKYRTQFSLRFLMGTIGVVCLVMSCGIAYFRLIGAMHRDAETQALKREIASIGGTFMAENGLKGTISVVDISRANISDKWIDMVLEMQSFRNIRVLKIAKNRISPEKLVMITKNMRHCEIILVESNL